MLAIYLHIPFCRTKCTYCGLFSITERGARLRRYVPTLQRSLRRVGAGQPVTSVYFGGGTPALLAPGAIGGLLAACAEAFALAPDAEVTLEAHPGAVSRAYLHDLRRQGVNRLSFGVQSAHNDTLRRLGRWHTVETAERALRWARTAGFDAVGVDMIYGLPGEDLARWRTSLARVLRWGPDHVSAYALTVEPDTPLARQIKRGQTVIADADSMADMYDATGMMLARAGLVQYELSNWARPGMACRHNLHVWRGRDYLGFGAGAHGCIDGVRYRIVADVDRYLQGTDAPLPLPSAVDEVYKMDTAEQMAEFMILGLRLTDEGVSGPRFASRFGRDMWEVYGPTLDKLVAQGLLEKHAGDAVRLTPRARLISNQVFVHFV